jgi:hypothetical protein
MLWPERYFADINHTMFQFAPRLRHEGRSMKILPMSVTFRALNHPVPLARAR